MASEIRGDGNHTCVCSGDTKRRHRHLTGQRLLHGLLHPEEGDRQHCQVCRGDVPSSGPVPGLTGTPPAEPGRGLGGGHAQLVPQPRRPCLQATHRRPVLTLTQAGGGQGLPTQQLLSRHAAFTVESIVKWPPRTLVLGPAHVSARPGEDKEEGDTKATACSARGTSAGRHRESPMPAPRWGRGQERAAVTGTVPGLLPQALRPRCADCTRQVTTTEGPVCQGQLSPAQPPQ